MYRGQIRGWNYGNYWTISAFSSNQLDGKCNYLNYIIVIQTIFFKKQFWKVDEESLATFQKLRGDLKVIIQCSSKRHASISAYLERAALLQDRLEEGF